MSSPTWIYNETSGAYTGNDGTYRQNAFAGLAGGAAGLNKQWLPSWDGEILRAYDEYNVFSGLVMSKSIPGISAEFPITGTVKLQPRWAAGEELIGNTNEHASDTIAVYIDRRPMAVYFETDNIDEFLTQWEHRSELARQAGQTLANTNDKRLAAYILRAAAESWSANDPRPIKAAGDPPVFQKDAFQHLGSAGATATQKTNAALELLEALEEAFVYMQENNLMTDNVMCAVTPRAFHDIRALGVAREAADLLGGAGRPFFGGVAEAGGLGAGLGVGMNSLTDSLEYMGARILKTNHLPSVNYGSVGVTSGNIGAARFGTTGVYDTLPIGEDRYNLLGKNAGVKALIWKPDCVASLQKMGVKTDTDMDIRRGTMFTVSSMFGGAGVLRPECAFAVLNSAVTPVDPDGAGDLNVTTYTEGAITRENLRGALGMISEYKSTAAADYTASYGANGGSTVTGV